MKYYSCSIFDQDIHEKLKKALHFPNYYGKNADALYDELTSICRDTTIEVILNANKKPIVPIDVFLDAADENPYLTVVTTQQE